MASLMQNRWVNKKQWRLLIGGTIALVLLFIVLVALMTEGKPKTLKKKETPTSLSTVVDESFSEANAESAMLSQQVELDSLKKQMIELKDSLLTHEKELAERFAASVAIQLKEVKDAAITTLAQNKSPASNAATWQTTNVSNQPKPKLHSVAFHYGHKTTKSGHRLSSAHYVPSGTFVRAVVLGGADADASVNGQSKNNGVMLFKLLQPGTLPNGQQSRLQGCFVTASSYGDISSERAYVILDRLSCAQPRRPIIDKAVTGWAFFGGKVGIKGVPLMRDNKVMQWAGISGAMAGIASAAQYSQSVQSISALGSATSVPSTNIAPYAAYGGASKAAEVLSNYYVKRAEQYHPVIQVGAGNLVTIVFKEGFFLEPDEALLQKSHHTKVSGTRESLDEKHDDFTVPPEVLSHIDKSYIPANQEGASS